jgi:hypothetical protein
VTPAAVPASDSEATVGKSDDASKEPRKHGKSDDVNGKGANGGVDQPQPPIQTLPVQQVPAVQPPVPSNDANRSKADHWSHKQQGGSNDFGGSVSSPPVTTQPVTPAVTSVAQTVDAQVSKVEQQRDLSQS